VNSWIFAARGGDPAGESIFADVTESVLLQRAALQHPIREPHLRYVSGAGGV
jgi:hypothetical protein